MGKVLKGKKKTKTELVNEKSEALKNKVARESNTKNRQTQQIAA